MSKMTSSSSSQQNQHHQQNQRANRKMLTDFSIDSIIGSTQRPKGECSNKQEASVSNHKDQSPAPTVTSNRKQHHRQQTSAKKFRPKNFQCLSCKMAFSNNGQLKNHVRIHTGERPFSCNHPDCNKTFTRNEELTRHKLIHTGVRPHTCTSCGKRFGRKDHLKKHARTHERKRLRKRTMARVLATTATTIEDDVFVPSKPMDLEVNRQLISGTSLQYPPQRQPPQSHCIQPGCNSNCTTTTTSLPPPTPSLPASIDTLANCFNQPAPVTNYPLLFGQPTVAPAISTLQQFTCLYGLFASYQIKPTIGLVEPRRR